MGGAVSGAVVVGGAVVGGVVGAAVLATVGDAVGSVVVFFPPVGRSVVFPPFPPDDEGYFHASTFSLQATVVALTAIASALSAGCNAIRVSPVTFVPWIVFLLCVLRADLRRRDGDTRAPELAGCACLAAELRAGGERRAGLDGQLGD